MVAAALFVATAAVALAAWQSEPPRHNVPTATIAQAARQAESPRQGSTHLQQQMDAAEASPFVKWLKEDVVYIIVKEELASFQRLTTDKEREKFVEQFWLRRDPTPGTPENEFKEEHYRRIAYANERFAGSKPGWKTDRGRIYIQSGPPDEIESHPSGSVGSPPFEIWRYRYLEGTGQNVLLKFIDRARTGDYQLATQDQT